jgi:hypothetical protein
MKEFEGKKVFVRLKSNSVYNGIVEEVNFLGRNEFGIELWMFLLRDKFNNLVGFSNSEIELIQVKRDGDEK